MAKKRVLINGLGRIGRAILRINLIKNVFDLVAINDINPDNNNMVYLIKYDSTFGRLSNEVTSDSGNIYIDGKAIRISHEKDIKDVDMSDIDIVIDASGIKSNTLQIESMAETSNVKKYIITNVGSLVANNIIFGVNDDTINTCQNKILSSSICDTISLGPIYKLLNDNFEIESGFLTTLHPWLSYQNLLDGPAKSWSQPGDVFSHYALGRSSVMSLIPKSTSAISALSNVISEASDKISSFSYRTPTSLVSSAVFTVLVKKKTTVDEIVSLLKTKEDTQKFHVIQTTDEPLISVDYIQNDYSVIVDTRWIKVNNDNHIEIVYWYDNEWGYSSRIVDIISCVE